MSFPVIDSLRLLLLGSPGVGKTRVMRKLIYRSPIYGVVVDPNNELSDPPERYQHLTQTTTREIVDNTLTQKPPSILFIDEAHRFIHRGETIQSNVLLKTLDVARNTGLSFVLATKHATLLTSDVVTLSNFLALNPPRTPAVQRWLAEAGIDFDINKPVPEDHWLLVETRGGEQRIISEAQLLCEMINFLEETVKA